MGRKKIRKRLFCLLGVVFIFIASVSPIVYAEENEQTKPAANTNMLTSTSDSWFATKDELLKYNTNDIDGNKLAKKVYFGQNNSNAQEWWVVGQDPVGEGLVLFAASPLATGQKFESNNSNKSYDVNWGCTYEKDIDEVRANHYGASELRATLQGMEKDSSRFSVAEQSLMIPTTITTYDALNSRTYTTNDVLYALYSEGFNNFITAGTNSSTSLDDGLRIYDNYWRNSEFWLRTPFPENFSGSYPTVKVTSGDSTVYANIDWGEGFSVVPAFQLDLSSVIFASSAKASTSGGTLATSDTFTLRYKEDNNNSIGSVSVDTLTNTINVENAKSGAYLVVQNSNGAWSKSGIGSGNFKATEVDKSLISLDGCKVWLEYTDKRITTATEPITVEKAPTPEVKVASQTASTITVTELADQDKYGQAKYKLMNGSTTISDWDTSNEFKELSAGNSYTVYAKYLGKDNYLASEGNTTVTTSAASYTITIPQSVTAGDNSSGGQIAVNKNDKFDLGHKGQVYVKVSNNGAISNDGKLTLTRQNDTSNQAITSAMYVNNTIFNDINKNVAEFSNINDPAVSVSFGKPSASQGTVIPAGDYSAIVTYEIKYREKP